MAAPKVQEVRAVEPEPEVIETPVLPMRERLMQVKVKAVELQAMMNALLCPEVTDVPSMQQVIVWAQGKMEQF